MPLSASDKRGDLIDHICGDWFGVCSNFAWSAFSIRRHLHFDETIYCIWELAGFHWNTSTAAYLDVNYPLVFDFHHSASLLEHAYTPDLFPTAAYWGRKGFMTARG